MHKKAMDCAKKVLEEFAQIQDPTKEQAELFASVMCGYKDFVETEYKVDIIDAMKKAQQKQEIMAEMSNDRMGYTDDHMGKRYQGRVPMWEDNYVRAYIRDPDAFENNMRMGYRMGYTRERMDENQSEYGRAYDQFRRARRNYTENHTPESMSEMEHAASQLFDDLEMMAMDSVREMDPGKRQQLKNRMQQLAQKMPG